MSSDQKTNAVTQEDYLLFVNGVENYVSYFNKIDKGEAHIMSHLLERYRNSGECKNGKNNCSKMWGAMDQCRQMMALRPYTRNVWEITYAYFNLFHMLMYQDFSPELQKTIVPWVVANNNIDWARWFIERSSAERKLIFKKMLTLSIVKYDPLF